MTDTTAIDARRREIASEHILFRLVEYVEAHHPGLIDHIDASIDHLGDPAHDDTKDDDAVRDIARRFLSSVRREGAK